MAIIDADAHVVETDHTWDFLDESERRFRPSVVVSPDDPEQAYWIIDGKLAAKGMANVGRGTTKETRELLDIPARLRHMDELGTDIQVLYPSMLTHLTDRPEFERALFKSYNRWLAEAWSQSNNRLRWVARLPLMSINEALDELQFAVANGACGVFIRSIEGQRLLRDPYFFPLYEEASRLNVPMCVHASIANPALEALWSQDKAQGTFARFKLTVISAFHSLLIDGIPDLFPDLRFGFIEVSAQWVPFSVHELTRRYDRQGRSISQHLLHDSRFYVASEVYDDLPYVLQYVGEDNLVMGTDYSHADNSAELEALKRLRAREDVSPRVIEKILDDNPRALYGI